MSALARERRDYARRLARIALSWQCGTDLRSIATDTPELAAAYVIRTLRGDGCTLGMVNGHSLSEPRRVYAVLAHLVELVAPELAQLACEESERRIALEAEAAS